jgi:hypothetical protein
MDGELPEGFLESREVMLEKSMDELESWLKNLPGGEAAA